MRRVFIAIDISEEVRRAAAEHIKALRDEFPKARVAWLRLEKLHLTLKFLGDVSDEKLEMVSEAVKLAASEISNFKLKIADTGIFPSSKKPRVLWLDVKDVEKKLAEANELIELNCEKSGFQREGRKFAPHLTIARLKEPQKALAEAHLKKYFEPVEFEVSEIVIYESVLQPRGSTYTIISKHDLGRSA